jgi:hypothetical protein
MNLRDIGGGGGGGGWEDHLVRGWKDHLVRGWKDHLVRLFLDVASSSNSNSMKRSLKFM